MEGETKFSRRRRAWISSMAWPDWPWAPPYLRQIYATLTLRRWLLLRFDFDSIAVLLPFDCNPTALRPFDDLCYYGIGLPVCGLLRWGLNKEICQYDCDWRVSGQWRFRITPLWPYWPLISSRTAVEPPSNRSRTMSATTARI